MPDPCDCNLAAKRRLGVGAASIVLTLIFLALLTLGHVGDAVKVAYIAVIASVSLALDLARFLR